MSEAISSSGDIPDSESTDNNCSKSISNSDNNTTSTVETTTTTTTTAATDAAAVTNNNSDSNSNDVDNSSNKSDDADNSNDDNESAADGRTSQPDLSNNPFAKISSSDDKNNEAETENDSFFPAPKLKLRSFLDYATSFNDSSTSTITQSNGSSSEHTSDSKRPLFGSGFMSLDNKNIGGVRLQDPFRKAPAPSNSGSKDDGEGSSSNSNATSSDNISSTSDTKQTEQKQNNTVSSAESGGGGGGGSSSLFGSNSASKMVLFGQNFNERVSSQADGFKASSDLISFSDISNSEQSFDKNDFTQSTLDGTDTKINSTKDDKFVSGSSSTNYFSACADSEIGFGFGAEAGTEKEESDTVKGMKRSFEVISGEEDEETIMTVPGSLYSWDSDKSTWIGKGKGNFKLNDSKDAGDGAYSRLIVRSLGVHKVLLNARLVHGMKVDLANETAIRFATVDGLHLFKSKKKINELVDLIKNRIARISKRKRDEESSEAEAV